MNNPDVYLQISIDFQGDPTNFRHTIDCKITIDEKFKDFPFIEDATYSNVMFHLLNRVLESPTMPRETKMNLLNHLQNFIEFAKEDDNPSGASIN